MPTNTSNCKFKIDGGFLLRVLAMSVEKKVLVDQNLHELVDALRNAGIKRVWDISKLNNDDLLILAKPMSGIRESVAIANQFYAFSGLAILLMGIIVILIFIRKITKPVIEINNVAEGISKLDFSKRIDYNSQDELGNLAKSINNISEELSASISSLQLDVKRRKQLVRNISHELRTPIGVIKGYAEGLKFGVAEDREKAQKYCTVIASECDRMNDMVKELLELSALEESIKLEPSGFDAGDLINSVVDKFTPVLKDRNIILTNACTKGIMIDADYELLERAISNYLNNAINHVDEKGQITISNSLNEDAAVISVFNTGNHISENDIKNIWDVFYKVDKARSREYGGFGLGLSIVKSIIEAHQGSCGVKNVKDGVEFFITLPQRNLL